MTETLGMLGHIQQFLQDSTVADLATICRHDETESPSLAHRLHKELKCIKYQLYNEKRSLTADYRGQHTAFLNARAFASNDCVIHAARRIREPTGN